MHEMGLTRRMLAAALEQAERDHIAHIGAVEIEISPVSGIEADEVRGCFEIARAGTAAEGAALTVQDMALKARCRACGAEVAVSGPSDACACGSVDLEIAPMPDWRLVAVEAGSPPPSSA